MTRNFWFLVLLFVLTAIFGLAGCLAAQPGAAFPTDTPLPPTTTPTATIVWFPPTPTITPLATGIGQSTPAPDASPVPGGLLLDDDFSDPTAWSTGRMGSGGIAFGNDELTLAINRPNGYLYSLRQGTKLGDFYLEITANPTICRGDDEYGLLLRVSPGLDFYRFSLTCDGQARVDKLFQGSASSPQGLTPSGAAPRGAPSQSRLAVQAKGRVLSFYINGEYQFSIRDPSLSVGGLGVFARAAGEDAVTVNFSDLQIYQPTP
jgi:hypothetical protein